MVNQHEKVSQNPRQRYLHRLRLLPIDHFTELEATLIMPALNGIERQGSMLDSPLLQLEHLQLLPLTDQELREDLELRETGIIPGFGIDDSERFEKYNTLPIMVLKDASKRQEGPTPTMESEIVGAASNASVLGLGNILGYIFKYGNNLLIQRGLGIGLFGLYTLGMSVIALVASIFDLGMDEAMIRFIAIYRGRKQTHLLRSLTIFCTLIVGMTGILGALLIIFFATPLAIIEHKPETAPVLLLMAPLVPMLCLQSIWLGGLQGLKEFKRRVFVQRFVVPLSTFIFMLIAILFFRNIIGVVIVTFLGSLLTVIINLYFLFKAIGRVAKAGPEEYKVREWVGFAVPNFLTAVITTVLDSVDTLLLAFFVSVVAIGQYAAALKISGFIGMPLLTLNVMFSPTIAELYGKGEHQKLDMMFKVVTKWSILLSLPIFEIAVLFAVPLLEISGKEFISAWPILVVFSVSSILSAATGSVGYMLLMTGHQKISAFNSALVVILNVVLGVILTKQYGALGTAFSTGLALAVVNAMRLIEVRILLKMQPYNWSTLKPLGAGLISAALTGALLYLFNFMKFSVSLSHKDLPIQLLLIPVFLASYAGLLVLFKISPEDQVVVDRLRKKLGRGKKQKGGRLNNRSQGISAVSGKV